MKNSGYNPSKELFSKCVKAGSRFYYIDAKQDSSGNHYLVISESRLKGQTGERERQRIFVYQEDLSKFVSALGEVTERLAQLETKSEAGQCPADGSDQLVGLASIDMPDVEDFLPEDKER